MKKRYATAVWTGGKSGKGHLTTETTVLNQTPYTFSSRFEDGTETNPEELVAAAHSGCFSMKLSIVLEDAGFKPTSLETKSEVTIDSGVVTGSHLTLKAQVDGISDELFAKCVKDAEENCPISKLLDTKITVDYTLN
ncbi:OsmC family protein [Marinoscillum sp. MHG1-6]|uniref:OsmC family protein n=1 Tax=Marinoscillum sp. MHG1-6 TaxID=2959627 RepID=UPI00215745B4|nr:OsmC family protein [Marinoscillum sp. MHG1-6]